MTIFKRMVLFESRMFVGNGRKNINGGNPLGDLYLMTHALRHVAESDCTRNADRMTARMLLSMRRARILA